jgi:hypothetical protein
LQRSPWICVADHLHAEMECKILPIPINHSYDHDLTIAPRVKEISVLARRLLIILPAMTLAEAMETTRIHRVAGRTGDRTAWVTTRPCRAPHHTRSDVGLAGGRPSAEAAAPRQSPLSSLGRPTVRPG